MTEPVDEHDRALLYDWAVRMDDPDGWRVPGLVLRLLAERAVPAPLAVRHEFMPNPDSAVPAHEVICIHLNEDGTFCRRLSYGTEDVHTRPRRLAACVAEWPDCDDGEYNPSCCRFPKSCSARSYDRRYVREDALEQRGI